MSDSKNSRQELLIGALVVALGLACFFLLYWNRFLGYRAGPGIFTAFSWMINQGAAPYIDFYCAGPILYVLRGSALLALFGDQVIATRVCGVVERCLLGVLVYLVLSRLFPRRIAVLPALTCIALGSSDRADPIDVYTQEALMFSVISIFAANSACSKAIASKKMIVLATLAGLAAGLSFFTKQTIGFGSFASMLVVAPFCLWRLNGLAAAKLFFGWYVGGFSLCTAAVCGWLASRGALKAFIVQAFIKGPASKGANAGEFFGRFIDEQSIAAVFLLVAMIALVFCWKKLSRSDSEVDELSSSAGLKAIAGSAAVALLAIACGALVGASWPQSSTGNITIGTVVILVGEVIKKCSIFFSFYATLLLSLRYLVGAFRRGLSPWEAQVLIYASVAFADSAMVCLSFPFYEAVLTPGFALILALLLNRLTAVRYWLFMGFCFLAIGSTAAIKMVFPYYFEDFCEAPVNMASQKLKCKKMAGFVLPPEMATFIDETVQIVKDNTKPEDTIYVYPEGSIFYPITERRCPTFSLSHNVDTTPDAFASSEAELLLEHPPKVLIYYRSSEETMKSLEQRWRNGRLSGNRKIMAACEELAQRYQLVKKFPFPQACKGGLVVEVYVKPK